MPNTPPPTRRVRHASDVSPQTNHRGDPANADTGFKKPSEGTMRRTQYAKTFLEDYYKHLSVPETASQNSEESKSVPVPVPETNVVVEKKKHRSMTLKKKFLKKFMGSSKSEDSFEITEPTSFAHTSHVGISQGGLQTQNLPEDLQQLVEKVNASLGRLGARSLSQDELKTLLAQPEFYKQVAETRQPETKTETVRQKRKLSSTIARKVGLQSKDADSANIQIGAPVNFVKVSGFNFNAGENPSSLKMKLDLANKALQHESELRTASEQRSADLSFSLSKLQIELDRLNTLARAHQDEQRKMSEFAKTNKHQEMELAMWKKRLFTQTQRADDNLAAEVQKRRDAEAKYLELLAQTSNKNNNSNDDKASKMQQALEEKQMEMATMTSQFEQEKSSLRAENEVLRREIEEARTRGESEKKGWESQRDELSTRMDEIKIECVKKVDESARRLEVERQQRRIDQMLIETLSKTNAEYHMQIEMASPKTPLPVETKATLPPPIAPPLPTRALSKNSSATGIEQSIRDELSSVKLLPVKDRDEDEKLKRATPQMSDFDALVLAILARRQSVSNAEDDDVPEDDDDGAANFDD